MANHNIEINKTLAIVTGIATAVAFGMLDGHYGFSGKPVITAIVAGVVGFGIGYSDARAGSGVLMIDALVFGASMLGTS